jgi:hypothetical protein
VLLESLVYDSQRYFEEVKSYKGEEGSGKMEASTGVYIC